MEISRNTFEKTLNTFIPNKYKFVERVKINKGPYVQYGLFVLDLTVITKDNFIKRIKPECQEKITKGEVIAFWTIIKCFGKFYDIIGFEKDIQMIYKELSGNTSFSRDITIKMEVY